MSNRDIVAFVVFCLYRVALVTLAVFAAMHELWVVSGLILGLAAFSSYKYKGDDHGA